MTETSANTPAPDRTQQGTSSDALTSSVVTDATTQPAEATPPDADQPTTLVILGASGDLTHRLLLPGLGTQPIPPQWHNWPASSAPPVVFGGQAPLRWRWRKWQPATL